MIKKIIGAFIPLILVTGCATPIQYTVYDQYLRIRPHSIAILPVEWNDADDNEAKDVSYLLRTMTREKLNSMNYRTVPFEEIDEKYLKQGRSWFSGKRPEEIARFFNSDAVLYIRVGEWNKIRFVNYASLKVQASFELYSARGTRLWQAEYKDRDMDLRLDTKSMEFAIIKAYEPKVQRLVDASFITLPQGEGRKEATQTFFQWLP